MKRHYLLFAALIVIGIGAVYLLIPGERELAYMHMKDKFYGTALESYEKRYAAGDLSVAVAPSLVKLRLQHADVDGAIEVLERYIEKNPGSIDARLQLGTLYQWAQRTGDHLRNLEEINRLQPMEENFRKLSAFYSFTSQYDKQIGVLKELVKTYPTSTAKDLIDLATLQASLGRLNEAVLALRRLEELYPQEVDRDVLALWVSLLLDTKNEERALKRSQDWLAVYPEPDAAAQFASIFNGKGKPALGLLLLQPFEASAHKHPELLVSLIEVEIATGNSAKAFARLNRLYEKDQLSDAVFESFIELALSQGKRKLALEASRGRDPRVLSGKVLTGLVRAAIAEKRSREAEKMLASLGKEFLDNHPILAAELALALGKKREMNRRIKQAERHPDLSDRQKIRLANLYIRLGRKGQANRWLQRLVASESTLVSSSEDITGLYLKLGRAREGMKLFGQLRTSHPSRRVEFAWVRLAIGARKTKAVRAWLAQTDPEAISDRQLADLYYLASAKGSPTLALTFSERLYRRRGGQRERLLFAKSLVAVGRPNEALPHLRALLLTGVEAEEAYFAALSAAHARGAPVASELERFLIRKLAEPNLPNRKREAYVYGLLELKSYRAALPTLTSLARRKGGSWLFDYVHATLESGQKELLIGFLKYNLERRDLKREKKEAQLYLLIEHGGETAALPYLREFAETYEGEWTFAYENALRKLGRRKELLAYWEARVSRSDVPLHERREIAFRMLEYGYKRAAERAFFKLARNAPPDSPDTSQLLYLWGPRPEPSAIDWLEERARSASGAAKAAWLNHLVNAGAADRAIAVIEERSKEPTGPILDAYFNALLAAHDRNRLASVIESKVSDWDHPERVRRLARLALQEDLMPTARLAYIKLLKVKPDDLEALVWLGRLDFYNSRYAASNRHLGRIVALGKADYESNLYYGDLKRRENDLPAAKVYYQRALDQIEGLSTKSSRSEIVRAHLLNRLGRMDESMTLFEDLLQRRPNDTHLRTEYVNLLLDSGNYERAEQNLLFSARSHVPTTDPFGAPHASPVTYTWPNSVVAEELKEGRELLLRFNRPLEEADLRDLHKLVPDFVESINSGYDTVLLRTDRNAEHIVLTTALELTVRWRQVPAATRPGLKSEDQLRLDLLEARLLMETGRERAALQLLDRLGETHPQHPRVLASRANLEDRVGRWRPAFEWYSLALSHDPENEDYQEAKARVWSQEAARVRLDFTWEKVEDGEEERILTYSGHLFLNSISKFLRVGFVLDQNHISVDDITRANGQIKSFNGVRLRGEVYLRYDMQSGSWIRSSLYLASNGVGGGLLYALPDLAGETRLLGEFQRPNWDFPEGVVDHGTRDRIQIQRYQRLTTRLHGSLAGAFNRYGIDGDSRVATSYSIEGSMRYFLTMAYPIFSIGYGLDKEHKLSIEERTDELGGTFNPMPLVSREIHSIDFTIDHTLTSALRVEGTGGYAFDRLGDAGPFFGILATYIPINYLELQLGYYQSINPTLSSQEVRRVRASIMWLF